MRQLIRFVVLMLAVAGCVAPDVTYLPGADGGADAGSSDTPDADPGFLLIVPQTDLSVMEGQVTSFTVALSAAPRQPVTVTLTRSNVERLSAPSEIVFDEDNWSIAQSVSVTALPDDDAAPNAVVITLSAPGAIDDVDVNVTITDDDTLALRADSANVQVTEGRQSVVKVKLTAQPLGDLVLAIALNPALPGVATVSPTQLTFTAGTWNVDQDVVITAEQDLDVANSSTALVLTGDGGSPSLSLPVTVIDDDVVAIDPSPPTLGSITEGGASVPLAVKLTRMPANPVRITITPTVAGKVTLSSTTIDFTTMNWNVNQSITVAGAQDDDTRTDPLDLTLSASGVAGVANRTVPVTVIDNDVPTLEVSAGEVTVTEGNTVTLNVRLAYNPLATVTVTADSDNAAIALVTAGGTLTFNAGNYRTYQPVTIRAEHDDDLVQNDTFVRLQSTALGTSLDVPLHKPDDDMQVIETNMTGVTLTEIADASFGVRLRYRPTGPVTVMASTGTSPYATVSPTSVPFTVGNFNMFQNVTVFGTHDVDLVPAMVPVTLSGASAPAAVTVTATVTDVDQQAIVASTSAITVTEGSTSTFTVRLAYQPTGTVTVGLLSNAMAVATVSPTSIMFGPGTYANPVTVTVTGTQDTNAVADTTSISITSGVLATQTVGVTANDDDIQGLEVTATTLSVVEGMTGMVGVRLRQAPVGNVAVTANSLHPSVATLPGTTSFTFTSMNYTTYQYVTVSALQDEDLASNPATVRFESMTPALVADVAVTKTDDDMQAIDTSAGSVTVLEGGTQTFGVRLRYQPPGDVTVQVSSADGNKATASPDSLMFGPGDYAGYKYVTVTGTQDQNLAVETVAINLRSMGNAPDKAVSATVNDNDMQRILGVPTTTISLTEGLSTSFNVSLEFQPLTSTVTLTSSSSPTGVITAGNLTFTSANWQMPQGITVMALQDMDINPGNTTLSLMGAAAPTVMVAVAVTEDDTLRIVPSTTSLTVAESSMSSFTVALSNQPNATVTVSLGLNPAGVANLSASTRTFTTTTWNDAQTITVTPVVDATADTESTTVTLSSGVTSNAAVSITVTDNTVIGTMGWATAFGGTPVTFSSGASTSTVLAYKVTAPSGTSSWTLDDIGVITGSAGGQARLAIYSNSTAADALGRPDTLIASTGFMTMAGGSNAIPVTAPLSPDTVYWIALNVNNSSSVSIRVGGLAIQTRRCSVTIFADPPNPPDPFPEPFGSPNCFTTEAANLFATMHR